MLKTILATGQWLLDNAPVLLTKLEPLFSLTKEELEDITGEHVKIAVQAALPAVASISLDFIAKQFGIDRIKKLFREKIMLRVQRPWDRLGGLAEDAVDVGADGVEIDV